MYNTDRESSIFLQQLIQQSCLNEKLTSCKMLKTLILSVTPVPSDKEPYDMPHLNGLTFVFGTNPLHKNT